METTLILSQIESILDQWKIFSKSYRSPWAEHGPYTTHEELSNVFTSLISTIERFSPINSPYNINAKKILDSYPEPDLDRLFYLNQSLAGILGSLRDAYQSGYLQSLEELVHAEIFDDFLEMSEYLLEGNFKDAAAVMIGSVLEEHLRKLCLKSGIPLTFDRNGTLIIKKADTINSELEKQGVYDKNQLKQVTAWLGLRNDAAHGNYSNYQKENVDLMLRGVRFFITQYPA